MARTWNDRSWIWLAAVPAVAILFLSNQSRAGSTYWVNTNALADAEYNEEGHAYYSDNIGGPYSSITTLHHGSASGTVASSDQATSSTDTAYATSYSNGQNVLPGLYGSAHASANLADGTLHTYAAANGVNYNSVRTGLFEDSSALANAAFGDTLHFSIAGANSSTVTYIEVVYSIHGTFTAYNPGNNYGLLTADLLLGGGTTDIHTYAETVGYGAPTVTRASFDGFAPGAGFSEVSPGNFTFEGLFALHGASDTEQLKFEMDTNVYNGAAIDLSNTGSVNFVLPTGVTFTSDSGVFLTANANAVPEPSSLAMLGSAGVVCLAMRLRRRVRVG